MKSPRNECGFCGRGMLKAKRVYGGIGFCDACYKTQFVVVACRLCVAPARINKNESDGLCRRCHIETRRCIGCTGPVVKAALVTAEGPVCPNCRRNYPPHPKPPKKPTDHQTCSGCRRHRQVFSLTENGRPLCKKCQDPVNIELAAAEWESYWVARVLRSSNLLKEGLENVAWQRLFLRFTQRQLERKDPGSLALKLPRFLVSFQKLEQIFSDPAEMSCERLLSAFSTAQLRQQELVIEFLHSTGFSTPTREQLGDHSDLMRIEKSFEEIQASPNQHVVAGFWNEQRADRGVTGSRSIRSIRLNMRAAVELVKFAGTRSLSNQVLAGFLNALPGHRACLFAFVTHLKRIDPALKMPKVSSVKKRKKLEASQVQLADPLGAFVVAQDLPQLRYGLAAVLLSVFGMPITEICRLPRTAIEISDQGSVDILLHERRIHFPSELFEPTLRYLAHLDSDTSSRSVHLFPGRPRHQPISAEMLRVGLKKLGVPASRAGISARASISKAVETAT